VSSVVSRRVGLLALLATEAAAQPDVPAEFAGLAAQPVAALAAHPAIGPRLSRMAAGRQRLVSEALRGAGPGITWEEGWLAGHAHTASAHVLLGFAPFSEQLALMLWEGNSPSLFIPPRHAPWPEGLRGPLRRFNPALEAQMRFGT
jgi:hypothetical protein